MAKKITRPDNRRCEPCGATVPVVVEVLQEKNAGGEVYLDQEMSMKCVPEGHYTNLMG